MSNRTFVCFDCRTTERVPIYRRLTRNCRKCRRPAEHVYYKFRIPPIDDDKAWRELATKVRQVNDAIKKNRLTYLRDRVDRYTRALETVPPGRRAAFLKRLKGVNEEIAEWEGWR